MSANYALTEIRHGEVVDGVNEVTVFEYGDEVTGLSEEEMDSLRASGSVGDIPKAQSEVVDENERLKAELAQVRAQLEAAMGPANNQSAPGSGGQVMQENLDAGVQTATTLAAEANTKTEDAAKTK